MSDDIKNLREFFRELTHLTVDWQFERRNYDDIIRAFKAGDLLAFNIRINAVPNDIVWANMMDGNSLTRELYEKILNLKLTLEK